MNSKKTCFPHKIGSVSSKISLLTLLAFALLLSPMVAYGATVTLAWDANTEPDLDGYYIYYRTDGVDYSNDNRFDVKTMEARRNPACRSPYPYDPSKTECCEYTVDTVDGLAPGKYYFAATAYDENSNESTYSVELEHKFSNDEPILPPTGSLTVNLLPSGLAGAQWRVDGGDLHNSGDTQSGLSVGSHTVVYNPVDDWTEPKSETVTISDGQTTISGTYIKQTGSLTVNLLPSGLAGAQWRVDDGDLHNSGDTQSGLSVGSHTVVYNPVDDWTEPKSETVTISDGQTTISGTYIKQTGSLTVNLLPSGLAGAQWRVDDGDLHNSGDTQSGLSVGSHTVVYNPVDDWTEPKSETVTISDGKTTTISGTYIKQTGSLTVNLLPSGLAGAQWRVDGGDLHNSGDTQSGLSVGSHTVVYNPVDDWTEPKSETVTISDGQTTISGTYIKQTGSLTVNLLPSGLAGAQWRVDDGDLHNSGDTQSGLSVGSHTVVYNPVDDWTEPKSETVTISDGQTTISGTYIKQTGSLTVNLLPSGLAGAQWRVDDGDLHNSGDTQSGLSVGSHTVVYNPVDDWTEPKSETVTISDGQTTISGTYIKQTGSLTVNLLPSGLAGAQWRVDGGDLHNSGDTQSGLSVGSHTVVYNPVDDWTEPKSETVTISDGQTTISGTYSQDNTPPTVTIEAEDMPIKTTGGPTSDSDGWNIWGNGYIAENMDFAAGGTFSFEVMARGDYAGGAWPIMEVLIDQTPVGTVTVDSSSWAAYKIQASITPGTHEVAIAFKIDYYNARDDRDLYVDKVTITTENSPPAADAGDDQTVEEGAVVVLDGFNSSDPNDNITGYSWEQTDDGVKVDLTNPGEAEATFIATSVGTEPEMLIFKLTVIDAEGLQDTDTCSVQVTKAVSEDRDGDGVLDDQDDFPDDKNEHLDTDRDGIGNNEDEDDDGDFMPDIWEVTYGLNPLEDDAADDPDGDGVSNYDEYYYFGTNPNNNEGNFDPYPPALIAPDDDETVSLTPLLETEEFDDPNFNDVHSQTQWEIIDEDGFVVYDVTTDSSLTAMTVPKMILDYDTKYIWRVKFIDNHGGASDWSEDGYFTTEFSEEDSDGNGILDHQEVDDTLDLDKDGVADREQSDIKCIVADSGKAQIGVSIRDAENVDSILSLEVEEIDDVSLLPKSKGKPNFIEFGLLYFKLLLNAPGKETTVTLHLSRAPFGKGKSHKKGKMYKYDPVNTEWLHYSEYAEFSSDRKKVYLTLKDGGFGDADGIENGIIVDPLAFGSESNSNSSSDSFLEDAADSLIPDVGCFISATTTSRPSDRQLLSLWREIRGSELSIVFILMVFGYIGEEIFLRIKQKRGDGTKSLMR